MDQVKCARPVLGLRGCQICWWIMCILGTFLKVARISSWEWEKKWYQIHKDHEAYPVCQLTVPFPSTATGCINGKCYVAQTNDRKFSAGMCSGTGALATITSDAENDAALAGCKAAKPDAEWCFVGLYRQNGGSWRWQNTAAVPYTNWADDQGDRDADDHDQAAWLTEKGQDNIKKGFMFFTLIVALVIIVFAIVICVDLCAHYKGMKDKNKCCLICAMSGDITLTVFYTLFTGSLVHQLMYDPDWMGLISTIICLCLLIASLSITCNQCCTWVEGAPQAQTVTGMPVGQPMEVIGGVVK